MDRVDVKGRRRTGRPIRTALSHLHSKKFADPLPLRASPRQRDGEQLIQRGQGRRNLEHLRRRAVRPDRKERLSPARVRGRDDAVRLLHLRRERRRRPAWRRLKRRGSSEDFPETGMLFRDDVLDPAPRHRRQVVVPVDVVPRVDADRVPRSRRLAHSRDGLAPAANVGRGEERPVEHRAKTVRRRGTGGEDFLHEALSEDALDRLAARVGPEREEERGPEAMLPEEIDEPRDALERPAVRVDVDLEGEALQTSGGLRPLR